MINPRIWPSLVVSLFAGFYFVFLTLLMQFAAKQSRTKTMNFVYWSLNCLIDQRKWYRLIPKLIERKAKRFLHANGSNTQASIETPRVAHLNITDVRASVP